MKKRSLIFMALLLTLGACNNSTQSTRGRVTDEPEYKEIDFDTLESNEYTPTKKNMEPLGSFNLVSPTNGKQIGELETFRWEACENADTYTLEFSSHPNFIAGIDAIDYYKQKCIHATEWTFNGALTLNNQDYYWRVYAVNGTGEVLSNQTFSFYFAAPEVEEVKFDLGDADDWTLHEQGSVADISMDNSNFFGNNEDALKILFDEEDVKHDVKQFSDGWIIVAKTIEKNIYGTDAISFNMYYSGKECNVFVRLIDRDNEFWVCPVQVSVNAKQEVFLKFSDFVQRTEDVTVANGVFDYERIKTMEIVFERVFSDGLLLINDVRAVKFANYADRFISKLDFTSYADDQWVYENYTFETTKTEDALTLNYYGTVEGKTKINGYGFAKIVANQYFNTPGDSIKMTVKYTGASFTNVILRIYEEDTDRWSYKIPYAYLTANEEKTFVIPFAAFQASSLQGDGRRQFYKIINLQFGLEGVYGTGSLTFSDFEIVEKKNHGLEDYRVFDETGLIENFNQYEYSAQMFMSWKTSSVNKDEYMQLNSSQKIGGKSNKYSGQFEYKADMEPAVYTLPTRFKEGATDPGFTSFNFLMKDASIKTEDARFAFITKWSAYTTVRITLGSGEEYTYTLGNIARLWTLYEIPFAVFTLENEDYLPTMPNPITADAIKDIGFSFQYYYYDIFGNPYPLYMQSNPVYIDDICLAKSSEYNTVEKEKVIKMDGNIAMVDNFEDYRDTDDLEGAWLDLRDYDYQHKELSNVVSSEGGTHSVAFNFKTRNESPAYYISPTFDSAVVGTGLRVHLYSEVAATVHINLYIVISGSTYQYRATISGIRTAWTEYTIGLSRFGQVAGNTRTLTQNDITKIDKISFGMTYYGGPNSPETKQLYVDNLQFDSSVDYEYYNTRVIA